MKHMTLRWFRYFSVGPTLRISLGLSSLVVSLLFAADLLFGLLHGQSDLLPQLRARIAENTAVLSAEHLRIGDSQALGGLFRELLARDTSILSVAVRHEDGRIMVQSGKHEENWVSPEGETSSLDNVQVPLMLDGQKWGSIEISFRNTSPDGLWQWLRQPSVAVFVWLGVGCFAAFALYLRRVLHLLDPSAVIPERVRSAFDVFNGGVMIVDPDCRIMLMNAALRTWMAAPDDASFHGRPANSVAWFKYALPLEVNEHPWARAMASRTATTGEPFEFRLKDGEPLKTLVNATPIMDDSRKMRGCLVTFENVTPLHELNARLVKSMAELEESKREIEKKSEELQQQATRDPLTGCFNRRVLFDKIEGLFLDAKEKGRSLCCIMTDIDHFKSFNDRHGHAVGDQVLQAVSRSLASALRDVDVLCRYGGEEFCIVLPDVDVDHAAAIAERLRTEIQRRAGPSVRSVAGLEVTSSFGVACFESGLGDAAQLINMADQALYVAKKSGRNCVKIGLPQAEAA